MNLAARPSIYIYILVGILCLFSGIAFAQGRHGDVMVTVVKDKVVALPAGGSGIEESLGMSETVLTTAARGPTVSWDFLLSGGAGQRCS